MEVEGMQVSDNMEKKCTSKVKRFSVQNPKSVK